MIKRLKLQVRAKWKIKEIQHLFQVAYQKDNLYYGKKDNRFSFYANVLNEWNQFSVNKQKIGQEVK